LLRQIFKLLSLEVQMLYSLRHTSFLNCYIKYENYIKTTTNKLVKYIRYHNYVYLLHVVIYSIGI